MIANQEIIENIRVLVTWYREEGKTAPINGLLDCRDDLATWCFNLAEKIGDEKISYNEASFMRTIEISRTKQALIKKGTKIGAADSQAQVEHEGLFAKEILHEGLAFKMDLMLKTAYKVLEAISQRVSYQKVEESNIKFQNRT